MKWLKKLFFVCLILKCSYQLNQLGNLIKDFAKTQQSSTKINMYLCWKKVELTQLCKLLNKNRRYCRVTDNFNNTNNYLPEIQQVYVVDMKCKGAQNLLSQSNQKNMFTLKFRWLLLNVDNLDQLNQFYFGVNSNVYIVNKISNIYNIISIYKLVPYSPSFIKNYVYIWSASTKLSKIEEFSSSRNRSNLMGLPFNVTFILTDPDTINHLTDRRFKNIDPITKNNYVLANHVVDMINGTVNPIYRNSWGYYNTTEKKWDGLTGDLVLGTSEMGGSPLLYTHQRIPILEYSTATTRTSLSFIFKAPPLSYTKNIYKLPFDAYVWVAILATVLLLLLVLYVIVKWEWSDAIFKEKMYDSPAILKPNILEVCIGEVGVITQQGTEAVPKSIAGNIALIMGLMSLMFLYSAYSANIVALLQSRTESINSLSDLLNSRIKLGSDDMIFMRFYFKIENEPLRKAIYDQKIAPKGQPPNFMGLEEGISRMRNEFFAFHIEESSGFHVIEKTFTESEKCNLKQIFYFKPYLPAIPLRKNSSYNEILKISWKKIQETGIQQREYLLIYSLKRKCTNHGNSFDSVGLVDCYFPFLIFSIGFVTSLLIFILEIIYHRYIKEPSENVSRRNKTVVHFEYLN